MGGGVRRRRGKEEGKKFDKIVLSQNGETSHHPIHLWPPGDKGPTRQSLLALGSHSLFTISNQGVWLPSVFFFLNNFMISCSQGWP